MRNKNIQLMILTNNKGPYNPIKNLKDRKYYSLKNILRIDMQKFLFYNRN